MKMKKILKPLSVMLLGLLFVQPCVAKQNKKVKFRPKVVSVCNKGVSELTLMACNVFHESRGQLHSTGYKAGIAVGLVTLNRARADGKTVKQVILEPHQFSWTLGDKRIKVRNKADLDSWVESKKIAKTVLQLKDVPEGVYSFADITNNATYYHEKKAKPAWRKQMSKTAKIGSHLFYKEKL